MPAHSIILQIKPYSRPYIFFNFLLAVNNIITFDNENNIDGSGKEFKQKHFAEYNLLQSKFLFWDEQKKDAGLLSFPEVIMLLKTVKHIAKILLIEDADNMVHMISKKLMVLTENLQQDFFTSAQYIFETLKDQIGNLPEFNETMKVITSV